MAGKELAELGSLASEQESLRSVVGGIGGKTTKKHRIVNAAFAFLVIAAFVLAVFVEGRLQTLALEIGLLLLSLKFAWFLHNEARVNHFQFWILTSIEARLNNVLEEVRDLKDEVEKLRE